VFKKRVLVAIVVLLLEFEKTFEVIVIVNIKLLVELMIAIAVLAEDILFLALLFNYFVVFSSLSWFGTLSILLSFLRLFGNL